MHVLVCLNRGKRSLIQETPLGHLIIMTCLLWHHLLFDMNVCEKKYNPGHLDYFFAMSSLNGKVDFLLEVFLVLLWHAT